MPDRIDVEPSESIGPAADWGSFRVPVGQAPDGSLVQASRASRERDYRCPGCASPLLLRAGPVRAAHFAHQNHGFCSGETALHQAAKLRIAQVLDRCRKGARTGAPRLKVPCSGWTSPEGVPCPWTCRGDAWLSLADLAFDQVAVEPATSDGLRPDVLVLRQGLPVLGIEVLVSHAVDPAKAARITHPWVELEAQAILRSPRTWRPCQGSHPWRSACRVCAWAGQAELSEVTCPGDYLAQLAAACFRDHVQAWLRHRVAASPAVGWRCPWCRRPNLRRLRRDRIGGAALASALGPPVRPQVLLHGPGGALAVTFGPPRDPFRPLAITPLDPRRGPALRATPGLDRPHRLALNATSVPLAFVCRRCGRDCLGELPSPWAPLPAWSCL